MEINVQQCCEILRTMDDIVILSHRNPDGDTLGSAFALHYILNQLGKRSRVECHDGFPKQYSYLLSEYKPEDFEPKAVVAVDISDGALKVADSQDFSEEISSTDASRPQFLKADVLAEPLTSLGQFDVIVSNPPYVMEWEKEFMRGNVLDYEPHLALFVPDDDPLLFYRAVARWALLMLRPGGYGIVEINEALAFDTEEVFLDLGFRNVRTLKDLHDRERFVEFFK